MKTRLLAVFASWVGLAMAAALLAALNGARAVQAADPPFPPDIAPPGPASEGSSAPDYLIALPLPASESLSVPAGLSPEQAAEYARRLTYEQARPVLAELERLQAEGKIAGFQARPDLHAVAVQVAPGADASPTLTHLSGLGFVASATESLPACIVGAAKALSEQVLGLSRAAENRAQSAKAGLGIQATNPTIDVYLPPGSSGYSSINGHTAPTATVTLRILRGSSVIATQTTTSYSGGSYYFYPTYQYCPTDGYDWSLKPGDVVEVTANGSTVTTVVAPVSAWVDPVANIVGGTTTAGRSVEVDLYQRNANQCSSTQYALTVPTDGSGAFSADFTSQVDFDRRAYAYVYARDLNGNSTYYYFYAYRISAYFNSGSFYGYLKPGVTFTAVLSRTGSIVFSTDSGVSDADGSYDGYFTQTVQPGDVIQVSGGGISMSYTATSLDVTLDPAADQATGTTGAGRRVRAIFYKNTSGNVRTSCSYGSGCNSTTADGAGNFVLTTTLDLVRGDYAYVYVYDAEGNYQYLYQTYIPAILARLSSNSIAGYWRNSNPLTVTVKDMTGTVKSTFQTYGSSFTYYPGITLNPADQIVVSDGVITETMTVQNVTARLDGSGGHLTGVAPDGHLLAQLSDFQRASGSSYRYCSETTVSGGAYDLTFGGAQPGAQDEANVWSTGPDGHYTYRNPSAFSVNAQEQNDYVWGYSETPKVPVTLTLQQDGSPVVYTTTSQSDGYFYGFLSSGTLVTITQGNTLTVQTGDGDSVSLVMPALTANQDAANNRVYGTSPANEPVQTQLRRRYNGGWWSYNRNATADGSGSYSASFAGLYWERDCSVVQAGHRCSQAAVYYYNAASHQMWLEGPLPPPAGADQYESDDTTATPYTGIQSHSFHTITDTDWISFTVPATDISNTVPYLIQTFNLGWGMGTKVEVYTDTNQITPVAEAIGYEYNRGARLSWTPTSEGVYYLKISPPSSYYAAYCDAVYDALIMAVRVQVYLPMVQR